MADVIELFPHRQFTDVELSALCAAVIKRGWQIYFVHHKDRREQALIYRVTGESEPEWVIDKSRGLWSARDGAGRRVAAATGPTELIDALAGEIVAVR